MADKDLTVFFPYGAGLEVRLYSCEDAGADQATPVVLANPQDWAMRATNYSLAATNYLDSEGKVTFHWTEAAHNAGLLQAIVFPSGSLPVCTTVLPLPVFP